MRPPSAEPAVDSATHPPEPEPGERVKRGRMAHEVQGGERLVRLGWAGLVVTLGLGLLGAGIAISLRSFAVAGAAAHLLAALPVWLGVLVLGQREERARAERLEQARLLALAAEGRKPIFAEGGREADAAAALERFKRGGQLLLCLSVAAVELGLAWALASAWPFAREGAAASLTGAAALCGAAFALLLLGRYGFALAARGVSVGGAGGRRATSGALAAFLAGLSLALRHSFDLPQVDLLGWAFLAADALLGVEALLLLLLDLYRPRRSGEELRPAFDSRLLGLLSAPGDIARSIARAADYQFGFALSQTWFYRFLERWVAPLVGFSLLAFWLLSTLYVVEPHEQALVRRLGKTVGGPQGPGLHLKLPWPFDQVVRRPVGTPRLLVTGHADEEEEHADEEHHADQPGEEAILWTESHVQGSDQLVLLARRARGEAPAERGSLAVNLLSVSAHVAWRVTDLAGHLGNVGDPEALLELLVERELSFLFSGEDLDAILLQRDALGRRLEGKLRAAVAAQGLGVEIERVSLTDLHPPVEVGKAFGALTAAHEERAAMIHTARGWADTVVPAAESEALAMRVGAEAQARNEVALAQADARRFAALLRLDRAAPGVLRAIRLLDETVAGAAEARKLVLIRPEDRALVTDLDLQERVQAEELGLGELAGPGAGAAGGERR